MHFPFQLIGKLMCHFSTTYSRGAQGHSVSGCYTTSVLGEKVALRSDTRLNRCWYIQRFQKWNQNNWLEQNPAHTLAEMCTPHLYTSRNKANMANYRSEGQGN